MTFFDRFLKIFQQFNKKIDKIPKEFINFFSMYKNPLLFFTITFTKSSFCEA